MTTIGNLLDEYENHIRDSAGEEYRRLFKRMQSKSESPIEEMMLAALLHANMIVPDFRIFMPSLVEYHWPATPPEAAGCALVQQAQLGPYRADFLFVTRNADSSIEWLVIECDGHDFHERTKEQAQRDRARDRWMLANKIQCLRYTGSEIYRDVDTCVDQIMKVLLSIPEPGK